MNVALKILTLVCYFLPFTFFVATCNEKGLTFSYNKTEAQKNNEQTEHVSETAEDATAIAAQLMPEALDTTAATPAQTEQPEQMSNKIARHILAPTDTSLSGIGTLLYFKNMTGSIAIAVSMLLSLLHLFTRYSSRYRKPLLLLNLLCLAIFITDCLLSGVTPLWGAWLSGILLILQLLLRNKRNEQPKDTAI